MGTTLALFAPFLEGARDLCEGAPGFFMLRIKYKGLSKSKFQGGIKQGIFASV